MLDTPSSEKPQVEDTAPSRLSLRLRLARQLRGMTLKAVADAAGCSESLLSKIENGKASPSLPMLHRLVQALDTNIGWMFEEVDGEEGIVFRQGSRPMIALDPLRRGEGISLERVIPYSPGHLLQCNIHHIDVGGESAGPIQHAGEEVGYLLARRGGPDRRRPGLSPDEGRQLRLPVRAAPSLPQRGYGAREHVLGQHAADFLTGPAALAD